MKRYVVYLSALVALLAVWAGLVAVLGQSETWGLAVYALPVLGVALLGLYCAGKLSYDLLTFKNYPHEIGALEKDIAEANKDLQKRGFKRTK